MRKLLVRPMPIGWAVAVAGETQDMLFLSGSAAETAARRLGEQLAAQGEPVKLVILLRDGSIGGRILFPPAVAPAPQARTLCAA